MIELTNKRSQRELCYQCFLATDHCICDHIKTVTSKVKVIILQHIRERHKAIGTEKIVRLSISDSQTYSGIKFHNQKDLMDTLVDKNQQGYLLYPSPNAQLAETIHLDLNKKNFLVVLDGTWPHANRIYKENPLLKNLIPISINSEYMSTYRIRTQPNSLCLSTVEAVVLCLESLEQAPGKYHHLIKIFEIMIDKQCQYIPAEQLKNRKKYKRLVTNSLNNKNECRRNDSFGSGEFQPTEN